VVNEVNTTGIVEHVVVMYSQYGVIGLSEVETVSVELLFVNIDQKDATPSLHQTYITLPIALAHLQQSTPHPLSTMLIDLSVVSITCSSGYPPASTLCITTLYTTIQRI
jgi:hypothetical protein